jgi:two-component system chemotaxis sensor kinase CheA
MVKGLKYDLNASFESEHLISEIQLAQTKKVSHSSDENSLEQETIDPSLQVPNQDFFEEEMSAQTHSEESISEENFEDLANTDISSTDSLEPEKFEEEAIVEFEASESEEEEQEQMHVAKTESLVQVQQSEVKAVVSAPQAKDPKAASSVASGGQTPPNNGTPVSEESIRVSLQRVEKLLNFVGEMVILSSVLQEQVNDSQSLFLKKTAHQLGKVTKEIQDMSMSLRMVPIKPTFQKMQRIVRDTANILNKQVQLVLVGEETELDKTILERVNDPLVHLIRNSVDHGIEMPGDRLQKGKKAEGKVTLSAYHESGKIVIEVRDDGGGLNPEKLKAIAEKKGILKPGTVLSDREAYNLIFAPGFSTKAEVTDISGRGVGMDVVKTNIEQLNGEVVIESELGKGSAFKIYLPLTLAIIDGMIVKASSDRYVIPLSHVHEALKPAAQDVKMTTGLGEVLMLRGENLPIYRLGQLLGKKTDTPAWEMIAIIVRSSGQAFALLVDDIIGQYQVVIKQLGKELQGTKGVSGSTILGDGRPALILEPYDLLKKVSAGKSSPRSSSHSESQLRRTA